MNTPVTQSELYLAHLCSKAFLHLWSYTNLYKDQGKRGGGDGKELCDLAVIFGDDVFIFSDKHCLLKREGSSPQSLEQAWSRWYRRAVIKSAGQIFAAERWFRSFPDRIFLDRKCQNRLPIVFPTNPTVHRILTVRGAAEAAREIWGGAGTLMTTNFKIVACEKTPLRLGAFNEADQMFHVFDEVALDCVLTTLDTVSDFRDYLVRRERFFRAHQSVLAAGEEELLGYYLFSDSKGDERGHDFVVNEQVTEVVIDESFWEGWMNSPQKTAKQNADRVSYCWDGIIEEFSFYMLNGTQYFPTSGGVKETEVIARWMAREPRMHRRMLAESLLEAMDSTPVGKTRRWYHPASKPNEAWWTFLVMRRSPSVKREKYREMRINYLKWQCMVLRHMHPSALDIVGIAVDPQEGEITEDALYLDGRSWSKELDDEALEIRRLGSIFTAGVRMERRHWEYPIPGDPGDDGDV